MALKAVVPVMVLYATMQPTLEYAKADEHELLLELMEEYYRFDHLLSDRQKAEAALIELLEDQTFGYVWLIRGDTVPAGYIVLTLGYSLEYHGRDAFIDEFYLRAPFRGQGWGQIAIAHVEGQARRLGVRAVHLEVERENRAAQALYRKAGYADHDRYLMTKRPGRSQT